MDVASHLGSAKSDLLRIWTYFDADPYLQQYVRNELSGRTPADVAEDVSNFVTEKFRIFMPLSQQGMRLILQLTTHETQLVAVSPYPPPFPLAVGFASASYYRLDAESVSTILGVDITNPYPNETAAQKP